MWIKCESGNYLNSDHVALIGVIDGNTVAAVSGCPGVETIAPNVNVCDTIIKAIISGEKILEV